jgi:hypothetical protein
LRYHFGRSDSCKKLCADGGRLTFCHFTCSKLQNGIIVCISIRKLWHWRVIGKY